MNVGIEQTIIGEFAHLLSEDGENTLCGEAYTEIRFLKKDDTRCRECKKLQDGIEVTLTSSGQIRRYGPSEYKGTITDMSNLRTLGDMIEMVKRHVRTGAVWHTEASWYNESIKSLIPKGDGVWEFYIFQEYLD